MHGACIGLMHVKLDVLGDVPFELEVMREAVGHEFFCRRSRARDQLGNQQELKFCNCNAWRNLSSAFRSDCGEVGCTLRAEELVTSNSKNS